MLLAADIGNTNISLGVFDGDNLVKTFRLKTDREYSQAEYEKQLDSLLTEFQIDACVIVSVVTELNQIFKLACDNVFGINAHLFSSAKDFNMKIALAEPEKVGADRLVNAYAAISLSKLPAIVVDIGTAITFDIVSRDKKFLGGVIMPGVNLQFESLNQYTSKLPLVEAKKSVSAIGDSTENAILSGVIRGTAAAIDGLIVQCEKELGEAASVIITGGQGSIIAEYMSHPIDCVDSDLTLKGLSDLYLAPHVNLY